MNTIGLSKNLVLTFLLVLFSFSAVNAQEPTITISASVIGFDGSVQYLDASIINTGTLHIQIEAEGNPGSLTAVRPDGSTYETTPRWQETSTNLWEASLYLPTGWNQIWLTDYPELNWNGYGPWQPAEDSLGVSLVESQTFTTFEVVPRVRIKPNGTVITRYVVKVFPRWAQQDIIESGALSGLKINTTCEGFGKLNNGSFTWEFEPTDSRLKVKNKVKAKHLQDPVVIVGSYNLLQSNGNALVTGDIEVPNCSN